MFNIKLEILHTIFPRIVSSLEQFPPLNSFRSIYYIKVKLLWKLYENIYIFQPQKGIVYAEIICGNTVCKSELCYVNITRQQHTRVHSKFDFQVEPKVLKNSDFQVGHQGSRMCIVNLYISSFLDRRTRKTDDTKIVHEM